MVVSDLASLAFRAQLRHWSSLLADGHERVGWKLAFGIEAIERVRGARPLLGYLTSASRLPDGGVYHAPSGYGGLRFEAEVAVHVAEQVDPEMDDSEIVAAADAIAAALEIVNLAQPEDGLVRVVENNVLHEAFVLGDPRPLTRPDVSVTAVSAVDGREARRTTVAPPLVAGLREAAALLNEHGEALEPGDWLMTGSMAQTECVPGTRSSVSISGLGELSVRIGESPHDPNGIG
jgi:2-oxo-3-hexenedioate decarboxylase